MKEIEGYIIPVLDGHNLIQVANFDIFKKGIRCSFFMGAPNLFKMGPFSEVNCLAKSRMDHPLASPRHPFRRAPLGRRRRPRRWPRRLRFLLLATALLGALAMKPGEHEGRDSFHM
jgi:hypothetical protein